VIRITIGIYLPFSYFASLTQLEKVEYYSSGELRARGLTDNGNKFGEWIYFYPSGKKSAIGNFDQGMLHGVSSIFYPTEIQGKEIWKTRQLQDSAWYYHPSGSLHRKGVFENSRYANTWIHYLEDGVTERIVHY
jgi:antitoxin component YwqK of YwqJK toxin-antitoxin module